LWRMTPSGTHEMISSFRCSLSRIRSTMAKCHAQARESAAACSDTRGANARVVSGCSKLGVAEVAAITAIVLLILRL
jgi:hypothetical protein